MVLENKCDDGGKNLKTDPSGTRLCKHFKYIVDTFPSQTTMVNKSWYSHSY